VAWLQEKKPDGRVKSRIGLVNPKVGIPTLLLPNQRGGPKYLQ
jgi:hypothetical protein